MPRDFQTQHAVELIHQVHRGQHGPCPRSLAAIELLQFRLG